MDILITLWNVAGDIMKAVIANLPALGFIAAIAITRHLSKG